VKYHCPTCSKCHTVYALGANATVRLGTDPSSEVAQFATIGDGSAQAEMRSRPDTVTTTPISGRCYPRHAQTAEDRKHIERLLEELRFIIIRYWKCGGCGNINSYSTTTFDSTAYEAGTVEDACDLATKAIGASNIVMLVEDSAGSSVRKRYAAKNIEEAQEGAALLIKQHTGPVRIIGTLPRDKGERIVEGASEREAEDKWKGENPSLADRPEAKLSCSTVKAAKSGFLGFGAQLGRYAVRWDIPPCLEVDFGENAKVTAIHKPVPMGLGHLSALVNALKDPDAKKRERAAIDLHRHPGPVAVSALIDALKDADQAVRASAVESLRLLSDPSATDALIEVLKNEHSETPGYYAIGALGALRTQKSLSALLCALRRREGSLTNLIFELGEARFRDATPHLIELLGDSDIRIRGFAVRALGQIGDKKAVEALKLRLDDEDSDVRRAAADSIKSINCCKMEAEIERKVINIVASEMGVDQGDINRATLFDFPDDQSSTLDNNIAFLDTIMLFEEEFEIVIPDNDAKKFQTVGNAIDYIKTHMAMSEGGA
jgi:acyl carrier protein